MKNEVFFVSGIDTDIGKTYVTGMLGRLFRLQGKNVITQKLVQTGCSGISDDIRVHRKIMGIPLLPEDLDGSTCPQLFHFPCSPHLAAEMEGKCLDLDAIARALALLRGKYETVLLEGAGGLMVPLRRNLLTIDFIAERHFPLILVTSGRLGSLNHTLLSLEAAENRRIRLAGVVFNDFSDDPESIRKDSLNYLSDFLAASHPDSWLLKMGFIDPEHPEKTEVSHVGKSAGL